LRYLLALTCWLFLSVAAGQVSIPDFADSYVVLASERNDTSEYVLYLHSSHKCGFCQRLRRDFMNSEQPENLRVVFLEYDTPEKNIREVSETYKGSEVRLVKTPAFDSEMNFFPTGFIVDQTKGKIVKKIKGYRGNYWKKIAHIVR